MMVSSVQSTEVLNKCKLLVFFIRLVYLIGAIGSL